MKTPPSKISPKNGAYVLQTKIIYMPFCADVTPVIAPLAIERRTYEDGERKPTPVMIKIEGEERWKEKGTVLTASTTVPAKLACHADGDCCD